MNLHAIPWTLIEATTEGGFILLRYREFSNNFPKQGFPHRLNIFWQMSESDVSGLAEEAESNRMNDFENRLVEATE